MTSVSVQTHQQMAGFTGVLPRAVRFFNEYRNHWPPRCNRCRCGGNDATAKAAGAGLLMNHTARSGTYRRPDHRLFALGCDIITNQVALDRDRLCFPFSSGCRQVCQLPTGRGLVVTGLVTMLCSYLLCGGDLLSFDARGYDSTLPDATPLDQVIDQRQHLRGDASRQSRRTCRTLPSPPSALFYCLRDETFTQAPSCGGRRNVAPPPRRKPLRQSLKKLWYPRSAESQTRISCSLHLCQRGSKSSAYRSCSSPASLGSASSLQEPYSRYDVFLYASPRQ